MSQLAYAERLTELLSLRKPPVALALVDDKPEGITQAATAVPSACAFWRQAERGTFFAAAGQHFNCPVGSMVMGFELPAEVNERLGGLVQSMCDASYLSMDEAARIPSTGRRSAGIVYGPLSDFPLDPDVVLLWLNPAQAMIYSEAAGRAAWTGNPMGVTGRPGCAALPLAMHSNEPGLTLGCAGMRTFTEIDDDLTLAAIPGGALDGFIGKLAGTVDSNAVMRSYYAGQKEAIG
jgi:uncharacterized protein (DUF169 family)